MAGTVDPERNWKYLPQVRTVLGSGCDSLELSDGGENKRPFSRDRLGDAEAALLAPEAGDLLQREIEDLRSRVIHDALGLMRLYRAGQISPAYVAQAFRRLTLPVGVAGRTAIFGTVGGVLLGSALSLYLTNLLDFAGLGWGYTVAFVLGVLGAFCLGWFARSPAFFAE